MSISKFKKGDRVKTLCPNHYGCIGKIRFIHVLPNGEIEYDIELEDKSKICYTVKTPERLTWKQNIK